MVNRDALKEQMQVIKDEAESTKVCAGVATKSRFCALDETSSEIG